MRWNVTSCSHWRFYVIVDRAAIGSRNVQAVLEAAVHGGADAIQLRDKGASAQQLLRAARRLLPLARAGGVPLIINDRVDVAQAAGADGVHLGQEDLPVRAARAILGPGRLIGQSTHSLEQALAAQADGADYIGFGPIFATPTKPDYPAVGTGPIRAVVSQVRLPVVCIGGIDHETVRRVAAAGARCVAVVRAVCGATDPEAAARMLKRSVTQFVRTTSPASL
jgi:thiamine-phosphate pyrophosphorylase